MTLADQLTDYIHAAFTGLWIQTQEPDEAEREITKHAEQQKWKLAVWDIAAGLRLPASGDAPGPNSAGGDPLAALRGLPALGDSKSTALLLLHNFNRFLNNPEVVQATIAQLLAGKQQRTFIVVLSPVVQIPIELEKLFVVLEHALPDREQLLKVARELTSDHPEDLPQGLDLERVLEAGAGLTRYEAEGAFALSLTRHNAIRPDSVWELKAQALRKNNLLTLHRGGENFGSLGGLDQLKSFCCRALRPESPSKRAASSCSVSAAQAKVLSPKLWATKSVGLRCFSIWELCWQAWLGNRKPIFAEPWALLTPWAIRFCSATNSTRR